MEKDKDIATIDPHLLLDLVHLRMPFGKYKNRILCDLPESYLLWFYRKGFPPGQLGLLLSVLYKIKLNGLEYLLTSIKKNRA